VTTAASRKKWAVSIVLPMLLATTAHAADTSEATYQPPESGASLTVSAPGPTSTPIYFQIIDGEKVKTVAVLAPGWWELNGGMSDGARWPKIAANPKAKPLPSEAELLVPVDQMLVLIVTSHRELVRTNVRSCSIPFRFIPRDGFRYIARWEKTKESCFLGVFERALEPADAPEVPLTSLPRPAFE
jgi:hypothetical protein